ncbi:MAG: hypothetical protein KF795_19000 [Labilithrix sp.]|nr:hypothetical protein [Labilithrix sp.]
MVRRSSPMLAAGLAVGAALVVAAIWWRRPRTPVVETALEATVAVRISRHDALGMSSPPMSVREPSRVRAIVEALGVDAQPAVACPPDYASAELGLLLSGRDVYARRNVYVWDLSAGAAGVADGSVADGDVAVRGARRGGVPAVVVVSSSGCRGGPPADAVRLRALLSSEASDAGDAAR